MPTRIGTFADSEIDVRWREPLFTESFNQKLAVVSPAGIYRGFRMAATANPQEIEVLGDPSTADSVAIYLTADGYTLTLRRQGATSFGGLDLSAYAGSTVAIAIYADYAVGTTTVARLRAYEVSPTDEFTGATERSELVVLGIVNVPAGAVVVPDQDIQSLYRTSAWDAVAPEAHEWIPMLRNGALEGAVTGPHTSAYVAPYWFATANSNFGVDAETSDVASGNSAIKFSTNAAGAGGINMRTETAKLFFTSDHRLRLQFSYKVLSVSSSTVTVTVGFNTIAGASAGSVSYDVDTSAITASYVDVDAFVPLPAGASVVSLFEVTLSLTSIGVADLVLFDSFQLWLERLTPLSTGQHHMGDNFGAFHGQGPITLTDVEGMGNKGIELSYDPASDRAQLDALGAGTTTLEIVPPIRGDLSFEDPSLASLAADGRLLIPHWDSTTAFSLIWESEGVVGGGQAARVYVSNSGDIVRTINARYDGAGNWVQDDSGVKSSRVDLEETGERFYFVPAASGTFTDATWTAYVSLRQQEIALLESGNLLYLEDGDTGVFPYGVSITADNGGVGVPINRIWMEDGRIVISNPIGGANGSNPEKTVTPDANSIYAKNTCKAWGTILATGGAGASTLSLLDGFNIDEGNLAVSGTDIVVDFLRNMDDTNYSVCVSIYGIGTFASGSFAYVTSQSTGNFHVQVYDASGTGSTFNCGAAQGGGNDCTIYVQVFGSRA